MANWGAISWRIAYYSETVEYFFDVIDSIINAAPDFDELKSSLVKAIRAKRESRNPILRFHLVISK